MTRRHNLCLSFLMERNYEWQHSNGLGLGLGLGLAISPLEWYKRVTRRHFVQRPSMEPTVAKRSDESHSQHAKNKFNDSNRIFFLAELLFSDNFFFTLSGFFFFKYISSALSSTVLYNSCSVFCTFFFSLLLLYFFGRGEEQNKTFRRIGPIPQHKGRRGQTTCHLVPTH